MAPFIALVGLLLSASDARQEIKAWYDRWEMAFTAGEASNLVDTLAPEFRLVDERGRTTSRKTYVASLRNRPPSEEGYRVEILSIVIDGDRATVRTRETEFLRRGRPHRHYYRDLWRRDAGKWLLTESRTLRHG